MKRVSTEFKIGVLVVIGIALLITGVNYLKGFKVFEKQNDYIAVYQNINGLSESNPVTHSGYKVGQIKRIDLMGNGSGKVLVVMTIFEKDLKIPEGSKAEIYSSDLLGSKAIRIKRSNSSNYLEPNDTLKASTEATIKESVNRQVQPVKKKAENLISSIDSLVGIVQAILNEDARSSLSSSFKNFDQTMQNLENTANRLDGLVKKERKKIAGVTNNLERFSSTLAGKRKKFDTLVDNLKVVSDSLSDADIPSAVRNAKRSLADLSAITQRIDSGQGSLGKLIQTDTLHENLLAASKNLDKLLKDLRYHPDRYVHFSLFGRKDKDMELSKREKELLRKLLKKEEEERTEE
ncbi:MAG: MlaD family protein [Flavobacteriales bacterium]